MAISSNVPRSILNVIGDVWGKMYGKIQTTDALTLKKVQDEYDAKFFVVNAQDITEKINKQREALIIQEYGSDGVEKPWDIKVLLFAKELGVKLPSQVIFHICRGIFTVKIADETLDKEREQLLQRMVGEAASRISQTESITHQQNLFSATIPGIELIRFFRELFDLSKKEEAIETIFLLLNNPDIADELLRKRYCDRPPLIDLAGNKHPQPDQPIVGRYNEKNSLVLLFGSPPFYQVRVLHILAVAAYSDLLRSETLPESAKKWLEKQLEFQRYLTLTDQNQISKEIELMIEINIIRKLWDDLIGELRREFYASRNYIGLASKTKFLLDELSNTPNEIFGVNLLIERISENIKNSAQIYFIQNFKMPQDVVTNLVKQSNYEENYKELVLENMTLKTDYTNFYRELWTFWNNLRNNYLKNRRETLELEFSFAQEQKSVVESLDTLQKKFFTQINMLVEDSTKKINTGEPILDRALTIFGLELTEVALSHPDITKEQRMAFRDEIIGFFKEEIDFLFGQFKDLKTTEEETSDQNERGSQESEKTPPEDINKHPANRGNL